MADEIILDSQSRIELARNAPYNSTTIRWHHDTRTLNAYKVRLGGGSHSSGQYIPSVAGSKNTENLATMLLPGAVVETTIVIDDILRNDIAEDGERTLYIYGRDHATGEWITTATGALSVTVFVWRGPPQVVAAGLVLVDREIGTSLILSAAREFKVMRQDGTLPSGSATHAVEASFADLGVTGLFTSTDPVFSPHTDGAGLVPTEITLDTNDLGTLNILTEREEGDVRFLIEDAFGQQALQIIGVVVQTASLFGAITDPRYRDAVPPRVQAGSPALMDNYLPVWDEMAGQFDLVVDGMADLVDPETAPAALLPFLFKEMGLLYPDVPGYPEANLRRLLLKADQIHRTRFTEPGLLFYLGLLLPNTTIAISGLFQGAFLFCDSTILGLPTLDKINSAATSNNQNTYLFGPNIPDSLTITITGGSVSAEMQEFVRTTIRRELLYYDDPINPKPVTVVFVP